MDAIDETMLAPPDIPLNGKWPRNSHAFCREPDRISGQSYPQIFWITLWICRWKSDGGPLKLAC
jgi:hypothetical protein